MSAENSVVLFYSPGACSLAPMVIAEWTGKPYRLCRVEKEVRSTDVYKRINPLGNVPALRIGDRTLVEVSAIAQHLSERSPETGLTPKAGSAAWDETNQWLSYFPSAFHASFYPYFFPDRYSTDESDRAAVQARAQERIRSNYGYVDKHLSKRRYMLGDARSILDPYLYAMARWGQNFMSVEKEFPNVAAHQALMEKDPAVQFGLATERADPQARTTGKMLGHVKIEEM
jgi:glutathione S-transferase